MPSKQSKPQKKKTAKAGVSRGLKTNPGRVVNAPSAQTRQVVTSQPRMVSSNHGFRVVHREAVAVVSGSSDFAVSQYPINPGVGVLFPWLASVAVNWEKYTFHSCVVRYVPRCGTTAAGSVIIAPDFDAIDPPPLSEMVMLTYEDAVETAPWAEVVMRMTHKQLHGDMPRRFVRSTVETGDIRVTDCGVLNVATSGTTGLLGRLFVEYDVEFFIPGTISTGAPILPLSMNYIVDPVSALATYMIGGSFFTNDFQATPRATGFSFTGLLPGKFYSLQCFILGGPDGDLEWLGDALAMTGASLSNNSITQGLVHSDDPGAYSLTIVVTATPVIIEFALGGGSSVATPAAVRVIMCEVPGKIYYNS